MRRSRAARAHALESRVPKLADRRERLDGRARGEARRHRGGRRRGERSCPSTRARIAITATAPGKQAWESSVEAAGREGCVRRAAARSPRRAGGACAERRRRAAPGARGGGGGGAQPVTRSADEASTTTTSTADFPPPIVERGTSPQLAIGWVIAGAGLVGVGVGAGFGLSSLARARRRAQPLQRRALRCRGRPPARRCHPQRKHRDDLDDRRRRGDRGRARPRADGAEQRPPERTGRLRAVPNVARGGAGLMLEGSFQ